MQQYYVGAPYPNPAYKGKVDTAVTELTPHSFNVAFFIPGNDKRVMKDIQWGKFLYGIFQKEEVPFMLIDFQSMQFDVSFNLRGVEPEHARTWLHTPGNACTFFIVNADNYNLEAMRVLGLDMDFMNGLKGTLQKQVEKYTSPQDVDLVTLRTMARYSQRDMRHGHTRYYRTHMK